MSRSGSRPWTLPLAKWRQLRWRLDDARRERRARRLLYLGGRGVLDELAPDAAEHRRDAYVLSANGQDCWTRTLLLDWPPEVPASGDWLTGLRAEGDVALSLHVDPVDPGKAAGRLKGQRLWQTSEAQARALQERLDDPDTQQAIADADALLRAVRAGRVRLFSCTLAAVLRAATEEALDELERRVRGQCDLLGVPCRRATWAHASGFRSHAVPTGHDTVGRPRTVDSRVLAATFPFQGEKVSMGRGVFWGTALVTGEPVLLDVRDAGAGFAAPHACIVGPTGWGKTTAFWTVLAQELAAEAPPDVVLVDPKGTDYARITAELGGRRIRMGAGAAEALNVLDLPPADAGQPGADPVREQTRIVLGLVELLTAREGEALDPDQGAVAEDAIFAAYREAGADKDDPQTWELPPERTPTLEDVQRHLEAAGEGDEHARALARRLRPFASGTLRGLFSRRTTVALDAPVVSFDLSALDRALRPAAAYLIGAFVWTAARRHPRPRVLGLDEIATLLAHESSARLCGDLFAMGRSAGLRVVAMAQLLTDFERSAEGARVLDNAATVLLVRQAGGPAVEAAARRYGLSAEEQRFLRDVAQRGDGILVTPRGRVALHVEPSPLALAWLPPAPGVLREGAAGAERNAITAAA